MGLLEKAQHVKKELQSREAQINTDRIPGPAKKEEILQEETPPSFEPRESNKDVVILHELTKELLKAKNIEEFYDILLFSIMGQIGAASSSLIGTGINQLEGENTGRKWSMQTFRGVQLKSERITFKTTDPILHELLEKKTLIDLKYYQGDNTNSGEYDKFLSVDALLLAPLTYNGRVIAALLLGDKATVGEYSAVEKSFVSSVCRTASMVLEKIYQINELTAKNRTLQEYFDYLEVLEKFEDELQTFSHDRDAWKRISQEMGSRGIEGFAYYVRNQVSGHYEIRYTDEEDLLSIKESLPVVQADHAFISYLAGLASHEVIENPVASETLKTVFSESILAKMNMCVLLPHSINGIMTGFLIICRVDGDLDTHKIKKITWLSQSIFSALEKRRDPLVSRNMVVDSIEPVFAKIRIELQRAQEAARDLTIVLFALKNFRRFVSINGDEKGGALLQDVAMTIERCLTDNDFSFRYDRNKFIVLFPSKKKKYVMSMANTVRNEITQKYKKNEVPVMITFLTAEYPTDGSTITEILDFLD